MSAATESPDCYTTLAKWCIGSLWGMAVLLQAVDVTWFMRDRADTDNDPSQFAVLVHGAVGRLVVILAIIGAMTMLIQEVRLAADRIVDRLAVKIVEQSTAQIFPGNSRVYAARASRTVIDQTVGLPIIGLPAFPTPTPHPMPPMSSIYAAQVPAKPQDGRRGGRRRRRPTGDIAKRFEGYLEGLEDGFGNHHDSDGRD